MSLHYSDITVAQVVTAYELSGLNEFHIAESLDLLENDVINILQSNSEIYRERHSCSSLALANAAAGDKSSPEYLKLKKLYETLAQTSDNDMVRAKCLQWLMDEERGRNDLPAQHLDFLKQKHQKGATQEERLKKFNAMIDKGIAATKPQTPLAIEVESSKVA